jgi:hypothetical protein
MSPPGVGVAVERVFATQARDPAGCCQIPEEQSAADAGSAHVRRYGHESKAETTELIMRPGDTAEVIMARGAGRTSAVSALERT